MSIVECMGKVGKGVYKIGFGKCMKNKWATKNGDTLIALKKKGGETDETQEHLKALKQANGDVTILSSAAITTKKTQTNHPRHPALPSSPPRNRLRTHLITIGIYMSRMNHSFI